MQLILASTSPRRCELLALLGLPFDICPPHFEEEPAPGLSLIQQVERFALGKARSVAAERPDDLVLGSDTVIELDSRMLGKPTDLAEAKAMLTELAGREHLVHTAVALCCQSRGIETVAVSSAAVRMKPYRDDAIAQYLQTRESLGKAGAYSIQGGGRMLVERVDGDYTGVVGLPLRLAATLLEAAGHPVSIDLDLLYQTKPYPNWSAFAS